MKKLTHIIMTIAAAAAVMSCGNNAPVLSDLNGEWTITTNEITAEAGANIVFDTDSMRVYGCTSCNRFMAELTANENEAGKIAINNIVTTRKMCPDMATEQAVLVVLDNTAAFAVADAQVTLLDAEGNTLATLEHRTAEAKSEELNGEWNVTEIEDKAIETTEDTPFIGFDLANNTIYGNASCNTFSGELTLNAEDATIELSHVAYTQMACEDMTIEDAFIAALAKVHSYKLDGTLLLLDAEGNTLLTLEKR